MGEIGYNRNEFLHDLKDWEIRAIISGYRKRERTYCMMTRWSTFMIMSTGMADLKKAGISDPEDIMTFAWEKAAERDTIPDMDEIEAYRKQLQAENEQNRKAED